MKKRLTEDQFQACIKGLTVGQQTIDIAYGVLVLGLPQKTFITSLGLSNGAISQAVNRVWRIHMDLPQGFELVTVILPKHQAFIVKKWADAAKKKEIKK